MIPNPLSSRAVGHVWKFFRAGGFDQVRLESGSDLASLEQLDQKLWVALSCPTRGLEFDNKTLDMIDTDKDGRIRAPEIIAASKWTCSVLKDPDTLLKSSPSLPLEFINDGNPEGKQLLSSARQILVNLGKKEEKSISIEDTTDTARIFAQTQFNGDGIILPESSDDPGIQKILADIIACMGPETDRSGKAGTNQTKVDQFFAAAQAYSDWQAKAESDAKTILPLGDATAAAATIYRAIKPKIDDYFARCRLAAFDSRALGAVNRQEAEYLAVAAKDMTITASEIASFPLARIEPNKALPLESALNPAWADAIGNLRTQVIQPLLGNQTTLTEKDWSDVSGRLAPYEAWNAAKAGGAVEKLGVARVREILASNPKGCIDSLITKDKALEPEANSIAAVDKLVRYHRDLYKLLNNFVSFRDFYGRREKAVFQAGTLYLDQRSCDLCVRVEDMGKHGAMAHLSCAYLAYCELTRKNSPEKMTVACAFTDGDSDNLMVGRNGIFYDRKGQDWDATIVKIVDNPISIRQAFWAPYKRALRWVEDQIAKRAAAADADAMNRLTSAATQAEQAAAGKPPTQKPKIDIGVVAALGVAVGGITAALGVLLQAFFGLGVWMPVGLVALMLLISGPSMVIAWLKLRQRNLGPILDANGWAVNAKARINIPFGRSLTKVALLPAGSQRDLFDPYAESHKGRNRTIVILILAAILWGLWYFGAVNRVIPDFPKSSFVEKREKRLADLKAAEEKAAAEKLAKEKALAPSTQPGK